ncbi:MAG: response regulator [Alcanivoracaceae bacterium]|nr:response regulator [Alcanivoracaceae bacterium]
MAFADASLGCTASVFAFLNYMYGSIALAMLEVVSTVLFAVTFRLPNEKRVLPLRRKLLMGNAIFVLLAVFMDGGVVNTGLYWSLLVPFLALLLMGLPRAWYWNMGYGAVILILIVLHFIGIYSLPYPDGTLLVFPLIYISFALFSAVFEAQFEYLHMRYETTIDELQQLKGGLKMEVNKRAADLKRSNSDLKFEVKKHEETVKALKASEARFFQAQKMETIGTLVGGIAHDFNNMLAGINANLFMIKRKTKDDEDVQKRTSDIERLVMRASDMVKQLLTFARKDKIALEPLDMVSFMNEAFKLAEVSIKDHIQMKFECHEHALLVHANGTQLQQVLMNMVNNARDAVQKVKQPVIVVKVEKYWPSERFKARNPELKAASYATFTVIDNGRGITAEGIHKIFEPFYTTKDVGKGTGLGLAMCFGAVQSHHGAIKVQSEVGKGTAFKVFIPMNDSGEVVKRFDDSGTVSVGLGEMILLADDDQALREAQKDALIDLGYEVIEAKHGKQAVQLFEQYQSQISLVITDVTMPVMGGVQAVRKMREIQHDLRVIFVTGYDKDDTLDELPNMDECILEKPYTMDKLNKIVQQQLR